LEGGCMVISVVKSFVFNYLVHGNEKAFAMAGQKRTVSWNKC